MTELAARITALDDGTAVRLLTTITDVLQRRDATAYETEPTAEIRTALADFAEDEVTASEGDVARAALVVLAEDDQQAMALAALLDGPEPADYSATTVVLAIGAVLVALQTRVKFVHADGKTSLEITSPSMSAKSLVDLAGKFTGWLRSRPDAD